MNYENAKVLLARKETLALLEENTIVTPFPLIEEIIDKLPVRWDNPTLKILDPAMGRGAFLFVVKNRLMQYHSEQHIVENMLFGVDIEENNVAVARAVLNPAGKYNDNLECNDSLKKEWNMKFDVVVANPPYNKNGKEPLYYDFMREFSKLTDGPIRVIIPIGWLVGPKARPFREEMFNTFNITRIEYMTNERFNGEILQPTIIVDMTVGTTSEFTFVRIADDHVYSTTVNRENDIFDLGMPLYVNDKGKELIQAARLFGVTFETKTGGHKGPCVHLGPVNQSTYYLSSMPISWYVRNVIVKVQASNGVDNKSRVFHRCNSLDDANKLRLWMNSAGARMIIAMWATSYRNTGSNVGQVPAVIVSGEYSNEKAYKKLGLSEATIEWLMELDDAHTEVL